MPQTPPTGPGSPSGTPRRPGPASGTMAGVLVGAGIGLVSGAEPLAFVMLAVWTVASLVTALGRARPRPREQLRADTKALLGLAGLVGGAVVLELVTPSEARPVLAVLLAATAAAAAGHLLSATTALPRRVVLVGNHEDVDAYVASHRRDDIVVGCHVADAGAALAVQPSLVVPTTTSLETLPQLAAEVAADDVLVLPAASLDRDIVRELGWLLEGTSVTVGVLLPVTSVSSHRLRTTVTEATTVLEVRTPRAPALARAAKAAVDRVGALLLLVATSPLLAALWLTVRLDSRGPGIFVQTRIGQDGRPFRMFKLRTMHLDAEALLAEVVEQNEADNVLFKIRRDPRVTRFGFWLRRSSLDELPQLVNVLRGEMSLVGPRPALPDEVAEYDAVARRRLTAKPGLTGLWQVSGRSDLSWEESLRLDLQYTDNWRLVDDLAIVARTIPAVTMARGAY